MKDNKQKYIAYLVILVFTFILYANTIKNQYSLDDNIVAYFDKDVRQGINAIPKLFKSHYGTTGKLQYSYRPIVKISYAIEYEFFEVNPNISHLVNLLLYAILLMVLFNTLLKLFKDYNGKFIFSLLVVLLFAAHPLHTEVVASIKNRDALFSFLGGISGLLFILKFSEKQRIHFLLLSILSFTIGYFSKPDVMVFVAIYPLSLFIFTKYPPKKIILIFIGFVVLLLILRYLPHLFLVKTYRPKAYFENPLYFQKVFVNRIQAAFHSSAYYLKMMFYPHPLLFYYGYNMIPVYGFSIISVFSGVFHFSIFGYAIYIIKKNKILSFAILYYIVAISMFLNFIIPAVGIVAERFAFSAVLGFSIFIVWLLFKLSSIDYKNILSVNKLLKSKSFYIFVLIIIVFSTQTIMRNNDWYNDLSLYKSDIKYLNNSAKANEIYATKLLFELNKSENKDINEVKEIEKHYLRALEIDSTFNIPKKRLGYIYTVFYNKPQKGLEYLLKYIKYENDDSEAMALIALSYENSKQFNEAVNYYYKSFKIDSNYVVVLEKIANFNFNKGNLDSAIYLNKRIMKLQPNSPKPYNNIAKFYYVLKDTAKFNYYIKQRDKLVKNREYNKNN